MVVHRRAADLLLRVFANDARRITGTGGKDKAVVLGMLERGGEVRSAYSGEADHDSGMMPITIPG